MREMTRKTAKWATVAFAASLCVSVVWSDEAAPKGKDEAVPKGKDLKAMEAKFDKLKIARKAEMRRDSSPKFIERSQAGGDFDVAMTPPQVDFAIVQGLEPWFPPPSDQNRYGHAVWGGWGDVGKGPDGCFYYSLGNHQYIDGNAYLLKYDPKSRKQSVVFSLRDVVGWKPGEFGDGKLHGFIDIAPNGDLWLLSFFGPYYSGHWITQPSFRGSYLIYHNVFTGKTENLGIPLDGETFPYHAWDWERGVLFGTGSVKDRYYVIAYDTKARKMLYGGAPPNGYHWYNRGAMLDRSTGRFYTTNVEVAQGGGDLRRNPGSNSFRFLSWDRKGNSFTLMNAEVPANPVTGQKNPLRAHTKEKDEDGAFWCFSANGTIFKFYPDQDRTEVIGVNWGEKGKYISAVEQSPGRRYLYYVADAGGNTPDVTLVQFDCETKRRKAIGFLDPFYIEKYGYNPQGTYGLELDPKGESAFIYVNGSFNGDGRGEYGRPAIFHIHIPASERVE